MIFAGIAAIAEDDVLPTRPLTHGLDAAPDAPAVSGSETPMKDLKFEQKRSLTRLEAADQLTALAAALREGEDAELELSPGTLSLRIADDLRSEIEVEIGNGEIELEIEFKWSTGPTRTEPSRKAAGTAKAATRKKVPAKPVRGRTGTNGRKGAKRSATKTT
ncbi:amphi-Trp domain-containing protein [Streptomyces sp. RKAG337]|uniref:amphi-Trp domain-containing protein n=1 Tax=Streptomyces sp. RKAG337 TaxID=2893404 RepID=UPI0020333C85|nr:amphi-Trp domain-containing protein [Streptomyces sp. RKAG337]MCM2424349.1 amphi-Trp domain-containing protein [Streptomyces sp. RKAG337]